MKMFYDVDIVNLSDSELLDRQRVAALCEYDRYLRDYNRELEPTLWFEDGTCFTTWFRGDVNEFFRSSFRPGGTDYDSYEDTMRRGGHRVNNTVVWMNKDRAVAEVMCTLTIRTKIKGEWFDGAVCGKMHYRAEKRDGWGLVNCLKLKGIDFKGKQITMTGAGGVALSIAYNLLINDAESVAVVKKDAVVYDVNYANPDAGLPREAKKRGLRVYIGNTMSAFQGIRAMEIWTGKRLDDEKAIQMVELVESHKL
ncbi:MAG: hypothetical protein LUE19_06815 [Clostridiales bacterium]|nr:hypothetical protein [Clostridiales bacterium]